ncbi:hypothetical protein Semix9P1_phi27 [Clostridioides phage phiSemix9P1]|uniref:hypothetical protein n=1 Tax=unclassified Clostridioides TaxID=2635829 RepID=UPI0009C1C463|nr:hypothetical protein Semix9P1_phi27 [Clostridioides phage phiSemix9P1]MCC0646194.1 hypothetical protein [Clostridioides sp. ZZV14-6150]MCC0724012.1 hypothetical protein [Clostridioides sp. ZZV14-6104]MCC0724853.1 hypothetical protein [Clostridioides sp. ZZV14-6045]MCC0732299.1 hypothetical protein [Clostridioides sp. ZZV14-6048]MCC0736436.1 hypothetical protein [Clostridioides sp. ZZV14-6009]MCC0740159.1 hypothetical protein [Clostridioides sp. ZZV14-5902]MCC0744175.1 hypothetical protein
MTFKELVNKVRNLVLEAKKVTIEDIENNFISDNVEYALKELADKQNNLNAEINGQKVRGISIANTLTDMFL